MKRPDYAVRGAVHDSLGFRAALAAEMAKKVTEQDARDEQMKAWLLEIAPPNIREWIENEGVLSVVYMYGRYSLGATFDFDNLEDARSIVKNLNNAWQGFIHAKLTGPEEDLDIVFSAIVR